MNKKGFTMVELIAMLVVIGVLMAITIPNISGILKNNRESIGVEDINKMVGNAKQKLETGKAKYPKENECVVMTLKYVDNNSDFKTGVNSGVYDREESVIVVTKKKLAASSDTSEYKYYIRLVEVKDTNQTYIVSLIDYDVCASAPAEHIGKRTNVTDDLKFNVSSMNKDSIRNKINSMQSGLCSSVTNIYNE